jgi:hypothetical protein
VLHVFLSFPLLISALEFGSSIQLFPPTFSPNNRYNLLVHKYRLSIGDGEGRDHLGCYHNLHLDHVGFPWLA